MEKVKQIESTNYFISNDGIVYDLSGNIVRQFKANGYWTIKIKSDRRFKSFKVHRLVAIAFVPNPDNKPCVDHIDGNKENNKYTNLRWCTSGENLQFDNVKRTPKIISVKSIDKLGNEIIYENVLDACLYPWQKYVILQCCDGKRKSYNGFKWQINK